jgi:hypothetical protein
MPRRSIRARDRVFVGTPRIRVHRRKRGAVGVQPLASEEALSREAGDGHAQIVPERTLRSPS